MLTASISKLVPFTHNPTNVLAVHTSVLNALDYGTHIVLIVDLFVSHAVPSTSTVPEKIVLVFIYIRYQIINNKY